MIGKILAYSDRDIGRPRLVFADEETGWFWNCIADRGFGGSVPAIGTRVRISGKVTSFTDRQYLFSFSEISPVD
jgi:hypothetical protein